jgi:hypothetical protein
MLIVFCIYYLLKILKFRNRIGFRKHKAKILIIFVCAVVASVVFFTFYVKNSSSFGRILIWQITLSHIPDNFFFGVGIGNFPVKYLNWQIQYFGITTNSMKAYFLNAGESYVAFNEYLQLLSETGLVGFTCFISVLVIAFNIKPEENKRYVLWIKACLVMLLVSCFSSYPLHCNSILFLFVFCIATLAKAATKMTFLINLNGYLKTFILVPLFTLFGINIIKSFRQTHAIIKWELLRENYFLKPADINNEYSVLYPYLKTSGKFLLDYGERLANINEFEKAIDVLNESKTFYISYRTYISLADTYLKLNDTLGVVNNLKIASNLIPYKFYPKYALVKLYYETGKIAEAEELSNVILKMPVKKNSDDVLAIKKEILELLTK